MHGWMNGGNWLAMSFMMAFWFFALGAVVYGAVRLASRRDKDGKAPR